MTNRYEVTLLSSQGWCVISDLRIFIGRLRRLTPINRC
jgi:hypothetical protein